jgi:hypothetical protein
MSDLDKLIAAVDAGGDVDRSLPWSLALGVGSGMTARDAYRGSLDAALRLHDALLPGWDVDLEMRPLGPTIESGLSDVSVYVPYSDYHCISGCHKQPARAWLLAILRAIKARDAA